MKTISVKKLKQAGACRCEVELFERTFGKSARITKENCLKAANVGLDFTWAAIKLLDYPVKADYLKAARLAQKAYKEAITPTQKTYEEAGWACHKSREAAWKSYEEAREAYMKAIAREWKRYSKTRAIAFYETCKGLA